MIRVDRRPEPEPTGFDFDGRVRQPGRSALAELTGSPPTIQRPGPRIKPRAARIEDLGPSVLRKHDYWTRALDALHAAYGGHCAYASFYIEPLTGPTVDHFVAICRAEPQEAYEWRNYRLACSLMNSRKHDFACILDPCEIEDGWFALDLDTFDVIPGEGLDASLRERVRETCDRLLNTPECKSMRRRYFELHWAPKDPARPVPLWFIEEQAPFLTREMRRQGRVRPEEPESSR
jgi:hypothetical protein